MVTASAAWAQQAPPVRVRGEITKVEGTTLSIKSRDRREPDGEARRAAADRGHGQESSLADIKEGSFIGVSAMPQPDGTQKAYAHPHLPGLRRRASSPTGSRTGIAGPAAP